MHPDAPQDMAPDVALAQRLHKEREEAAAQAETHESVGASWRRKQQMCEAALSQIEPKPNMNVGSGSFANPVTA